MKLNTLSEHESNGFEIFSYFPLGGEPRILTPVELMGRATGSPRVSASNAWAILSTPPDCGLAAAGGGGTDVLPGVAACNGREKPTAINKIKTKKLTDMMMELNLSDNAFFFIMETSLQKRFIMSHTKSQLHILVPVIRRTSVS
jgi:hypothetical protein